MVGFAQLLAAGAVLAPAASAVGNARVVNSFPFPVTAWLVGSNTSAATTIQPDGAYSEVFSRDPSSGGRAIKITLQPDGLYKGAPQTNFAYNLEDNAIWYDLSDVYSDVYGDAFRGHRLVEASGDPSCGAIVWADGVPPAGSRVKNCQADADVALTLCAA